MTYLMQVLIRVITPEGSEGAKTFTETRESPSFSDKYGNPTEMQGAARFSQMVFCCVSMTLFWSTPLLYSKY